MKLTFKDVGQGDSILFEWHDEGADKIAIIDCNKKSRTNPVLEHVKKCKYKEIEFLILSHPHIDHYSGMTELLKYISSEGIIIKSFGHTLHLLGNDYHKYLNGVEVDTKSKRALETLFYNVHELRNNGIIKKVDFIVERTLINITKDIFLKCLSPSNIEAEIFMRAVDLQPRKNKTLASQSANYLSTVFKLIVGDKYYLLTSDGEQETFKRLMSENVHKNLIDKALILSQVPHHGAERNHYEPFWNYVTKTDAPKAVVSAGLQGTYEHPHLSVLLSFHRCGYTIHSTNILYGMSEYLDYLKSLSDLSEKLDTFSELTECNNGGDKSFIIA